MKITKKHLACLVLFLGFYLLPTIACLAASDITTQMKAPLSKVVLPSGDENKTLGIIGKAVNIFLSLLGVIFLILVIYGGFKWMMAQGKEDEIDQAKETIKAATIGLVIVLSAYAISYFVTTRLESALK